MPIDEDKPGWGVSGWGGTLEAGGGGGGGGSGDGPTVENFQPAEGTEIQPYTPVEFDVLLHDGTGLSAIVVSVLYKETGAIETVYDREGFSVNFRPNGAFLGSTRSTIPGGWHFKLRRRSGWFATPTVKVQGADDAGNPIVQEEL